MKCPYCSSSGTRVLDKRETQNDCVTRRRRECNECKKRFTTYENIEIELAVEKKDGRRESFDRNKLKNSVIKSCEKRPISSDKINQVITLVESSLLTNTSNREIKSSIIGEMIMEELKKLDKVAYIRFASVYRDFADITMFRKELDKLVKKE